MSRTIRDDALTAIRPVPDIQSPDERTVAGFESNCLEPILRLQEDLIFALIRAHRAGRQPGTGIAETMADVSLRDQLIGVVVGHLTAAEFEFYLENREEINAWIVETLADRIEGQPDLSFAL